MKRSQSEIDLQIQGLKEMRKSVKQFSFFGDNNWEVIDAQISVLEGKNTPNKYYVNESDPDYQDGDNELYFAADRADQWLKGYETEDLFEL